MRAWEVTNYIQALEYGLSRLATLPVSRRLLCEVHKILLADVRGYERRPGEVRSSQNWIGSSDNRIETAVFVLPPVKCSGRSMTSNGSSTRTLRSRLSSRSR